MTKNAKERQDRSKVPTHLNDNWIHDNQTFPLDKQALSMRLCTDPTCHLPWEVSLSVRDWEDLYMWGDWCLSQHLVQRHRLPNQAPIRWEHFRIRPLELSSRGPSNQNTTLCWTRRCAFLQRANPTRDYDTNPISTGHGSVTNKIYVIQR